tara:strand:- start:101 stop:955 length:855 start_codon:yes stop_codon:yes gene_type:complete
MQIDLGTYELDCDFDPRVVNNAQGEKVVIEDIGFIYNCVFKQRNALIRSVEATREIYPDSKTYLVSDGGLDYSFLEDENLKFSMQEDTVSAIKNINETNFRDPENQAITKKGMAATVRRLQEGLEFCEYPEWFCMTEPDVLIRGKISHPENAKLLGHRINYAWYMPSWLDGFMGINTLLSQIDGAIPILRWGAVPVIGHTQTLLKGIEVYLDNFEIVDKLSEQFHVPGTFDLFLPILFALAGEQEVFSDEYTECMRNPNWKTSGHPVVHQYREFYDEKDYYGVN